MKYRKTIFQCMYIASFALLILYSLRHVRMGVDMWDGGYNYANFRYNGLEYMDFMWFFATWLAGAVGNILTRLPGGGTMLGMNIYTSLIVGIMAAFSYAFCVRKLRIPPWIAFIGEIVALSLCWNPSGSLYNYLTYALLLAGSACLYQGLVLEREGYLLAAGALLGLNVGVRFSNLVQAGLILALWYYGLIAKKKFSRVAKETGICMLGYLGAYGLFLLGIGAGYGLEIYVTAIRRLFGMTEYAQDYKAVSMLGSMAEEYYEATYWLKRFALAAVCPAAVCLALPQKWIRLKQLLTALATAALLWWLYRKNYCQRDYRSYESIYDPCLLVFELVILLALLLMIRKSVSKERRLLAALLLLTILLTSLGSNNALFSSINNGFAVFPCSFGLAYEFCRERKKSFYLPFQAVMAVGMALLVCQALPFGICFTYEEAAGARDVSAKVTGIPVLEGMHTGSQKALCLEGLYGYLQENGLGEKECILYGNIPGMAYYMELAPAFNVWGDLRSYEPEIMKADLAEAERELLEGGEKPLVILESRYAEYADTGSGEGLFETASTEEKMLLICDFMRKWNYARTYENEKYVIYE